MSIRDLVVIGVIFALLPVCLVRPWIGVLVWSWVGYMNPHRLTWGLAYDMPFAMLVALATLVGLLVTRDRQPMPRTRELYILLALWGLFLITTVNAFYQNEAWEQFDKVSKILLMTFVAMKLLQDEKRVVALVYVIALSLGFFGLKGGIWALATGGHNQVLGPPDSFIEGNTEIGLALNMVLPLLVFLRREETRRWLKNLLTTMLVFSAVAVVFTYSRGAQIGLAVTLLMLCLKSRRRLAAVMVLAAALAFVWVVAPPEWFDKMHTIETYEEDLSAMSRLDAWYVAYRIALDSPLLGAGFRPFSTEVFKYYLPTAPIPGVDAHSIFFQVLAEHGFPGLALYVGLILSTFLSLGSLIRRNEGDPSRRRTVDLAQMIRVSLIAYVTSGLFLSLSYFDLFYHLVAITIILQVLVRQPAAVPAAEPVVGLGRVELAEG